MAEITGVLPGTARRLLATAAGAQTAGRLPSLVAGVVRDQEALWSVGRGLVQGQPPDDDVQYRIGSITKTVVAVEVLRLRDEGRLDLDDPLERFVPGTPFGARTVGQLLAHDAGLRAEAPGEWWERVPGGSWDELAAVFTAESELPHPAGRRFHYSNLGFGALGQLIGEVRGRSWSDVVLEEVLLPLEMTRTTLRPTGRAAQGWAVHPWADVLLPEPEHDAGAMAPAGQFWSTIADLGRFASLLLGNAPDVLSAATVEEMREPATVDAAAPGWLSYGLGLQVARVDGRTLVGHGGSMPGFLAGLWLDPEQHTAVSVMANATTGLDAGLAPRLLAIVHELEPWVSTPWTPMAELDEDSLRMIGVWYWGTAGYGLRLLADGDLDLIPLGSGRGSRFRRRRENGSWYGLSGYHTGEPLRPVIGPDGQLIALDLGSFIFTRTPYDPTAPVPGGVDPGGWGVPQL